MHLRCKIFYALLFSCIVCNYGISAKEKCKNIYLDPDYYSPFDIEISCLYRSDCVIVDSDLKGIYRFKQVYYTSIKNMIEKAKKNHVLVVVWSCRACHEGDSINISEKPINFEFVEISPSDIKFDRDAIPFWDTSKRYKITREGREKLVWLDEVIWNHLEKLRSNKKILFNQTAFGNPEMYFPYLTKKDDYFKLSTIPLQELH